MITGSMDYLKLMAETHHCLQHPDNELTVATHPTEGLVIRCGAGHFPEEVTRDLTALQEYKLGTRQAHGKPLDLMVRKDLGTGKDISADQEIALLDYANRYGLDAWRGHVMLMYGKPYIGIDGYLWYARVKQIPYSLVGRPLTKDEMEALGYLPGDIGYKSIVRRLDTGGEFEGLGIITEDEKIEEAQGKPGQKRYPVIADKPGPMVQKRGDWQALRRAFPIGEETTQEEG